MLYRAWARVHYVMSQVTGQSWFSGSDDRLGTGHGHETIIMTYTDMIMSTQYKLWKRNDGKRIWQWEMDNYIWQRVFSNVSKRCRPHRLAAQDYMACEAAWSWVRDWMAWWALVIALISASIIINRLKTRSM